MIILLHTDSNILFTMSSLGESSRQLTSSNQNRGKRTRVPLNVLQEVELCGAIVQKLDGEDLYSVSGIVYGDKSWVAYEQWADGFDKQLRVGANFGPGPNIANTALAPPDHLVHDLQRESRSIVNHYAGLKPQIIENGRISPLGPPLHAPPIFSCFDFAKLSLSYLMNRIQDPPDNYPVLRSLKSGSYICTFDHQWANAGVEIELFKD
jgi:hypothetical protein